MLRAHWVTFGVTVVPKDKIRKSEAKIRKSEAIF